MCDLYEQYNVKPEFETLLHGENEYNQRSISKLKKSKRNRAVYIHWLQKALNKILNLQLNTDGKIDNDTINALKTFQKRNGLVPNGMIDSRTEHLLLQSFYPPGINQAKHRTVL